MQPLLYIIISYYTLFGSLLLNPIYIPCSTSEITFK